MADLTTEQTFNLASQRHRGGRLAEAEALYRQILGQNPDHAKALQSLGVLVHQTGRSDEGLELIRRSIAVRPDAAEAHNNLGMVLKDKDQIDDAIAAYRQALALNGDYAAAWYNLGVALADKGDWGEAIKAYRRAILLRPRHAKSYNNLGNALKERGQIPEAIAMYQQAIDLAGEYAEAHCNLGAALRDARRLDEAIAACRRAIALRPNLAEAYGNLGAALRDAGQLDEAIAAYRQGIGINPELVEIHSSLVYALHLHPDFDANGIAQELEVWHSRHAETAGGPIASRPAKERGLDPNPASEGSQGSRSKTTKFDGHDRATSSSEIETRRLRIGYVSPDLRNHPVGRFLAPLLDHHDRERFEIFCYADVAEPDAVTLHIASRCDAWRNIVGLSDEAVAALVRRDKIDILVDLAAHTGHNRLRMFARKPAPVQVTYLAYCSTTGLKAMDYRLTDRHLDPPGLPEGYYSEKSIRLPDVYWCYAAPAQAPDVSPLPALAAGYVAFGCLNSFAKASTAALSTWIRLLQEAPSSRLLLHAHPGEHRARLLDRLKQQGIDPARLTFVDFLPEQDYFRQYHHIDIALDPFPCAGGTTTCDALWMGVPVITLAGHTAVGRSGATLLANVGLSELVASSPQDYIACAVKLAGDLPQLGRLRATLRERMRASPLTDAPKFARNIEAAFRQMWRETVG